MGYRSDHPLENVPTGMFRPLGELSTLLQEVLDSSPEGVAP